MTNDSSALPDPFSCPAALSSPIELGGVNEPIPLFEGSITFTQKGKSFEADARLWSEWLPSPAIRFAVPAVPDGHYPRLDEIALRIPDGTELTSCFVTGMNVFGGTRGSGWSLSGRVRERVIRPKDSPAVYALFLLPNFETVCGGAIAYPGRSERLARLRLHGDGWIVTIDQVENCKTVHDTLQSSSGYGVTHVGRLEREDSQSFSAKDAGDALVAVGWYLSFCCGRWTGPSLPAGYDANDQRVWEVSSHFRTVPYQQRQSWIDVLHKGHVELPFSGFTKLWRHNDWKDVIRVAIHWFIEANAQAGSVEGAIVLTQTAFELLASAVLVENHGWLSQDGYDKLAAADRIRLLFSWAGIPTGLPAELDDLVKLAKADSWPDTPTAMTMIRNTITHPTRKNREKFDRHGHTARTDAWRLGLWHLELCLLRLFEYQGTYGNRLSKRWTGEVQPVPWAATTIPQSATD